MLLTPTWTCLTPTRLQTMYHGTNTPLCCVFLCVCVLLWLFICGVVVVVVFVIVVVGGLGSLGGAFVASLIIGLLQTFAIALDYSVSDLLALFSITTEADSALRDLWTLSLPQVAPILPYLLLVLILIFRPTGLFGKRET